MLRSHKAFVFIEQMLLLPGDLWCVQSVKPDVCLEDAQGRTPLEWAMAACNWEAARLLIRHGALQVSKQWAVGKSAGGKNLLKRV